MTVCTSATPTAPLPDNLRRLPDRVLPVRVAGMAIGAPMLAVVLVEHHAPWLAWAFLIFTAVAWAPLAWLVARRARDPHAAELHNLLIDPVIVGLWIALLHFNLLPSLLLVVLVTGDRINSGVRGLWLRSLGVLAVATLAGATLTGFAFQPDTSMAVIIAAAPMLVIHTLANSIANYRLVRRVLSQNRQLEAWSQTDALTGLANRRHWQEQATSMLQSAHVGSTPVNLLIIDVDRFKAVNDRHGHLAGDAALQHVAAILRHALRSGDIAGRIGGDELAVVLHADAAQAHAAAERIRRAIADESPVELGDDHVTASIGHATASAADTTLAAWIQRADAALYAAKNSGRDRSTAAPVSA